MSEFISSKELMAKGEEELFIECTRKNLAGAIPAPWDIYYDNGRWVIYDRKTQKDRIVIRERKDDDSEQIRATAHLVQDAPELAARVIELEKERNEARQERNQARRTAESYRNMLAVINRVKNIPQLPWKVENENV